MFGKQHRYCPNCGKHIYDAGLSMKHVQAMQCSDKCREEWSLKYARMVVGQNAEEDNVNPS
jgi:hypothetical protein